MREWSYIMYCKSYLVATTESYSSRLYYVGTLLAFSIKGKELAVVELCCFFNLTISLQMWEDSYQKQRLIPELLRLGPAINGKGVCFTFVFHIHFLQNFRFALLGFHRFLFRQDFKLYKGESAWYVLRTSIFPFYSCVVIWWDPLSRLTVLFELFEQHPLSYWIAIEIDAFFIFCSTIIVCYFLHSAAITV